MKIKYDGQEYKLLRALIENHRKMNADWDEIKSLECLNYGEDTTTEERLRTVCTPFGITVSLEDWYDVFEEVKDEIENGVISSLVKGVVIPSALNLNAYTPSTIKGSSWMAYYKLLQDKGFDEDTILAMKQSAVSILNKLSEDTRNTDAIKGLVIGNVQSGKTANMGCLMSMAADCGWNMFIVLSGAIENLRLQTQKRLINDLKGATNISWHPIGNVLDPADSLSNLDVDGNKAYLVVSLKNKTRLNQLITWLNSDKTTKEKLKILIIDDEADQAGINTAKKCLSDEEEQERTAINKCIVSLLTDRDKSYKENDTKFLAVNYIAYTATPYANILNESPGSESIYPANFVATLSTSKIYFGPQKIFGLQSENEDGLDIINTITPEDKATLNKIYKGASFVLPDGLKDAILWFYCCFAIQKYRKINKPVSMLVHTSSKQKDHANVAELIKSWIGSLKKTDFVNLCKKVYNSQTNQFTLEDFKRDFKEYSKKDDVVDYPAFEEIEPCLNEIIDNNLNSILFDTEDLTFTFSKGVHLCIDNCANNFVKKDNEYVRLIYPSQDLGYPTGFIVIGGATLSRGLTIEGLVSTYFLRTVRQADSLMQMGRFFGYRIGYELLPRIWLTKGAQEQFAYLSELDYELRKEMQDLEKSCVPPSLVGVKIMNHPKASFLQLSSKNKMQDAIVVSTDYAGIATQTTMFYDDDDTIESNYNSTSNFISSLKNPILLDSKNKGKNSILFSNISNSKILNFIESLNIPKNGTSFLRIDLFKKWYEEKAKELGLEDWNVVISGNESLSVEDDRDKFIDIGGQKVCLINRSRKIDKFDDKIIRIGALRSAKDLYLDVDINASGLTEDDVNKIKASNTKEYSEIREHAGLNKKSLLVIYFIDKNSKPRSGEKKRIALNTRQHLIGLFVVIPSKKDHINKSYLRIKLSTNDIDMEDEIDA